jgi:hypothetical protein
MGMRRVFCRSLLLRPDQPQWAGPDSAAVHWWASDGHEPLVVLFWPTPDRQSAAVGWLVQVLTSLGVAPSLATVSRLEVLMNAAIVAPVSLLGSMACPWVAGAPGRRTAPWRPC